MAPRFLAAEAPDEEDDRKTFSYGGEVKRVIEQKMQEHDDDPDRDAEYSLYRTMRLANTEGDHSSRN